MSEILQDRIVDAAQRACATLASDLGGVARVGTIVPRSEHAGAGLLEPLTELFVSALSGRNLDGPTLARVTACTATVPVRQVFDIVRLAARQIESKLAADPAIGETSRQWPQVSERLNRASFEVLAAYCERRLPVVQSDGVDPATTIVSTQVFQLAIDKELHRALRHHRPLSLILFDVDDVASLREEHGQSVAERLLERVAIFVAQYFRQHDWVTRSDSAQVAVLLPETRPSDAQALADRAATAIRERLVFPDRNDRPVHITVSGCVLNVTLGGARDETVSKLNASQMVEEAENTVRRVRAKGGNNIEQVEIARASVSVAEAASILKSDRDVVEKLIAAGTVPSVDADGETRVDRLALEAYARRMQKVARE